MGQGDASPQSSPPPVPVHEACSAGQSWGLEDKGKGTQAMGPYFCPSSWPCDVKNILI